MEIVKNLPLGERLKIPNILQDITSEEDFENSDDIDIEVDDGNNKKQNAGQMKNKKGKVEITYSVYIINKGIPDSVFQ